MTPSESTPPTVASSRNSAHDHHGSGHLARSAGTIGAATLTSRLLGLARDQTLAYLFGASNAMDAFDAMVETAECIVRNLGGEMRDQNKSVMTKQTVSHDRERVREFERRLLAQR